MEKQELREMLFTIIFTCVMFFVIFALVHYKIVSAGFIHLYFGFWMAVTGYMLWRHYKRNM